MRLLLLLSSALVCSANLANRASFVDICSSDDGNKCCANTGMKDSTYFIVTSPKTWDQMNLECFLKDSRLVVIESQRENDCLVKYITEGHQGTTLQEYAIGLKIDSQDYKVYEWDKIDPSATKNYDSSTPSFHNWAPANPTGLGCVAMPVGAANPTNGLWHDIDCTSTLLHGICEKQACPELPTADCTADTPISCECACPQAGGAVVNHPVCV